MIVLTEVLCSELQTREQEMRELLTHINKVAAEFAGTRMKHEAKLKDDGANK